MESVSYTGLNSKLQKKNSEQIKCLNTFSDLCSFNVKVNTENCVTTLQYLLFLSLILPILQLQIIQYGSKQTPKYCA